jgi:alpha-amylase
MEYFNFKLKVFINTKKDILLSIVAIVAQFKTAEAVVYHTDSIENGTILHAFSWSFNTIKQRLPDIRNAGYTAIQTSPIQECFIGDNGNKYFGNWIFEYQPISQNIGNYIIGTEDEFKSLCDEAKKFGIKIIVDAVLNHMTTDINNCAPEWRDQNLFHEPKGIDNWNDRYEVTQRDLVGLRDIKTQNPDYQQKVLDMLKRILADGASGFRYDTAKHIELPDDPDYGSQFWPTVLNNGAEFQYGELLQDDTSRDTAYANYMKITASNYGDSILSALNDNDFRAERVMNYNADVHPDRLITWVESHDNYSNDDQKTVYLTNEQIKLGWALIASREQTTPLFFSRPLGGGGGNPQFPNQSQLGDEGDPLYKDASVAAVNFFRNAMVGENEYLRNPNEDSKVLMIERGKKGVVIINLNQDQLNLESVTNLADGDYVNPTNNDTNTNKFKVADSKITGTLLGRSVTVLYNDETPSDSSGNETSGNISINLGMNDETSRNIIINSSVSDDGAEDVGSNEFQDHHHSFKLYFEKPSSWGNDTFAYLYNEIGTIVVELTQWPGKTMTKVNNNDNNNIYSVDISSGFDGSSIIFNDGDNQAPEIGNLGYIIQSNGLYNSNGFLKTYEETSDDHN